MTMLLYLLQPENAYLTPEGLWETEYLLHTQRIGNEFGLYKTFYDVASLKVTT